MLQPPLVFVILVAVAVAGAESQRRLAARGYRLPAFEGPVWIFFGWALGNAMAGLFPDDVLEVLRAVVLVGLAWIGLVFGMQIDRSVLKQLERWHRTIGLVAPILIGAMLCAWALIAGLSTELALGLAAIGLVSSPATLDAVARTRRPTDRFAFRMLRLVSAFSGIPAVVALAVTSIVWCPLSTATGGAFPWWHLTAGMAAIGLLAGYSMVVLVRGMSDRISLLTIVVGTATLIAGAAAMLGLSPLPTAVIAGSVVINRCVFPERLLRVAHSFERPLFIAMLVLVGASITGLSFSWAVFFLLTLGRFAATLISGRVLKLFSRRHGHTVATPFLGGGLLAQGALALGLAVALVAVLDSPHGTLEAVAAAMIANQVVAEIWARRQLFERDAGR